MNVLVLVATLLETLANAVPGIASGQSPLVSILDTILITAADLVKAGEAGSSELQALTAHVQVMVNSGLDPTEDDWNQLKARSDAAHTLIQSGSTAPGTSTAPATPASSGSPT